MSANKALCDPWRRLRATNGMQGDRILLPCSQALPHANEAGYAVLCDGAVPKRPDMLPGSQRVRHGGGGVRSPDLDERCH